MHSNICADCSEATGRLELMAITADRLTRIVHRRNMQQGANTVQKKAYKIGCDYETALQKSLLQGEGSLALLQSPCSASDSVNAN